MRRLAAISGTTTGLLLTALAGCAVLYAWYESGRDRYEVYQADASAAATARARRIDYRAAGSGLAFELETREIGPGHSLADLTARFPPTRVEPYRRFVRVLFRNGDHEWLILWAREGRVVEAVQFREASAVSGKRGGSFLDYFFRMSAADQTALQADQVAVWAARREAALAAAGAAATFDPLQWPAGGWE